MTWEGIMNDHEYHDIRTGECLFEDALEDRYAAMLTEVYGTVQVAGLDFDADSVLRNCDPIAYRCGFLDWMDSELGETISRYMECPEDGDENRCGEFDTHEFSTGWDPECVRCGAPGHTR